ncbi:hypothetical protein Tco_1249117, partial [Tanacetum coccineum]
SCPCTVILYRVIILLAFSLLHFTNQGIRLFRVILFGTIPIEIPIVPDTPTDPPTVPEWRDRVRFCPSSPSGSSSPDTTILSTEIATTSPACISTPVIIASPAVLHTTRVLSPTRADLLPTCKRYRGTSAMHSDESSDKGSPVMQTGSDMDSDIWADVEAVTATTATAIVNGLGIEPVLAGVGAGFEPGLAVVKTERIDILDDSLIPDAVERLGQLEEEKEGRNLIADSKTSGLLVHVVALEGSKTRLRDTLGIERVRADSLERRLGYVEEELRQARELRAHES